MPDAVRGIAVSNAEVMLMPDDLSVRTLLRHT
jgi:hypothetical protein